MDAFEVYFAEKSRRRSARARRRQIITYLWVGFFMTATILTLLAAGQFAVSVGPDLVDSFLRSLRSWAR